MSRPIISACVICYNQEKYIAQALESVLQQNLDYEFEIVVSDDASLDDTLSVIKETIKSDKRVRLISSNDNLGMNGNWIRAIQACHGKYIALLEGDDYWTDPLKLQKQVDFLEANPEFSLCFHEVGLQWESEPGFFGKYSRVSQTEFTTTDLFERHFIATCSIVFRNNLNFPEFMHTASSGDLVILLLASLKGKLKYLSQTMGVYRLNNGGISNQHRGYKLIFDRVVLYNELNKFTGGRFTEDCHRMVRFLIQEQSELGNIEFSNALNKKPKAVSIRSRIESFFAYITSRKITE